MKFIFVLEKIISGVSLFFANYEINNNTGIEYVENTCRAYGNDGKHFNLAVNDGENDSVSSDIADALFYASDLLPVIADFISVKTK